MAEKEELLHYIWRFRLFEKIDYKTTNGENIEIIDVGMLNTNSGPDFFNAKIKIDGRMWAGNVEIHRSSDEWEKHKHHTDKMYNSVILHVVENANCEVYNQKGASVPQMQMIVPPNIKSSAEYILNNKSNIPCNKHFAEIEKDALHAWMSVLTIERLERKTNDIYAHLARFNDSWEQTFYVLLCRNYGFGLNSDEFERLALSLPLGYIQKHTNNLFQIEAMMFGQAGMLQNQTISDIYYLKLQDEYNFLRKKYILKPIDEFVFKRLRVRPNAFPQVRIAQLAALLQQSGRLFSKILEKEDYKQLRLHFQVEVSEYWKTHYTFEKESDKTGKYLGSSSLDIILINTVVPILFAYGTRTGQERYCERSLQILEDIKAESNSIVSGFKQIGIKPKSAFDSQALIQLQREYCNKRKCLYCKIGYKILSSKK